MKGWFPAILAIASCFLYSIEHSHGCTPNMCKPRCRRNEKKCICPEGKPKPTPDPSGTTVQADACSSWYCSVNGVCKPEENRCRRPLKGCCENSLQIAGM